ncbi:hypothetical protein [Terricaulis sp.]
MKSPQRCDAKDFSNPAQELKYLSMPLAMHGPHGEAPAPAATWAA